MESIKMYLTASVMSWMIEEDRKAAEILWGTQCQECKSGVLHWGNWQGKESLPGEFEPPPDFSLRFSLCCSNRECRKRCTPLSIRFPPNGKFTTAVLLLVKLMRAPGSERRCQEIADAFCVSLRTVKRWINRWLAFDKREKTRWQQEITARFQLGTGGVEQLWERLSSCENGIEKAFQLLLEQCHTLWPEWQCRSQ